VAPNDPVAPVEPVMPFKEVMTIVDPTGTGVDIVNVFPLIE
jgi:hypothetical protein